MNLNDVAQKAVPQEAPVETPETPTTPEAKPDLKDLELHPRFAALVKREKSIQAKQEQAKALEKSIQEREAKIKEFESKYNLDDLTPQKALELLKEKGLSYEDLTAAMLGQDEEESRLTKLERQIQKDKEEREQREKLELEKKQKEQEEILEKQITRFKAQIYDHVDKHAEAGETELIKILDMQEEVYDLIDLVAREKNKVLEISEACKLIEDELVLKVEAAQKAKRFSKAKEEPKKTDDKDEPVLTSKTIDNSITGSAPSMLPAKNENDRMKRALEALSKGKSIN